MSVEDLIKKLSNDGFDKSKEVLVWVCGSLFEIESVSVRQNYYNYVKPEGDGGALIRLRELE